MKIVEKEKIIEATCDICGNDCMKELYVPNDADGDADDHDIVKEFEGMILDAVWGYASENDGEHWEAVVCEDCVKGHLSPIINFIKTPYL